MLEPVAEHEAADPIPESGPALDEHEPPARAKNPAAVALGKLGGAKGAQARAKKLTAQQRREIAKKAAAARWAKKR